MRHRAAALHELSSRVFDALVIGAGITGAGIARDAAMRGLSVALVDKGDFASGTSSRSSRLIHGGVRYLEHGHLHLVFEASAERRRLLRIAPHLVRPLAFTWPVYSGQRLPLWKIAAGLTLYDALALFRNVERHRRLGPDDIRKAEPAVRAEGLRGGVRYFDASTNDARLTLANAVDALRFGAVVANHLAFLGFDPDKDGARVARVEDALTGNRMDVRAKVVVNATGPWSDSLTLRDNNGARIQGSKGAHIAVPRERIGNRGAVTLTHPRDGRVMFALPANTHAIIGTTEGFTNASPDEVRANEQDVAYLLEAANVNFPDARLQRSDVVAAWAGIRPLMATSGSANAASREHAVQRTSDGMITITGGKLTTYRIVARDAVDAVQAALGRRRERSDTGGQPLPDTVRTQPDETPLIVEGLPYRLGGMSHSVEEELACTLGDLLIRRTHIAYETRDNGRAAARTVAAFLGWGEKELSRYDAEVERLFTIDK
jgi:glycerol-3-phosphate dehydrogenase